MCVFERSHLRNYAIAIVAAGAADIGERIADIVLYESSKRLASCNNLVHSIVYDLMNIFIWPYFFVCVRVCVSLFGFYVFCLSVYLFQH